MDKYFTCWYSILYTHACQHACMYTHTHTYTVGMVAWEAKFLWRCMCFSCIPISPPTKKLKRDWNVTWVISRLKQRLLCGSNVRLSWSGTLERWTGERCSQLCAAWHSGMTGIHSAPAHTQLSHYFKMSEDVLSFCNLFSTPLDATNSFIHL